MKRKQNETKDPFDLVEEASLESFPASDPPAWPSGGASRDEGDDSPRRSIVAGVFRTEESAARAFRELVEAHFDALREISIIAAHRRQHEEIRITEHVEVDHGAEIVGGVGVALGAVGATLVSLGIIAGPVGLLVAGPVVAAFQGAYAGGVVGMATGALAGLGVWHDEAEFHAAQIREGAFWMGVQATGERAELAKSILAKAGARHCG